MYQLLPIVSAICCFLPTFPTEVWCLIFRHLDQKSLLAVFRSCTEFSALIEGDPLLRVRVRKAQKQEQRKLMDQLTKPGTVASVTRLERARLFNTNCAKKIEWTKITRTEQTVSRGRKTETLGKTKSKGCLTNRFVPYRL
ncbi:hypothetical protein ABEB36_004689 [Hypothenemus hampei]|uniref:F-box domain-containing protein n=1 Tax=Hypothenemus hampei TaxID=57062 RepID=A0ABD1F452_HYPHA